MDRATDPAGNITQTVYSDNESGCKGGTGAQPERIIYPTFERHFTYNSLGRKLTQTDVLSDTASRTTGFAYDTALMRAWPENMMPQETRSKPTAGSPAAHGVRIRCL